MCRSPGRSCRPEAIASFAGRPFPEVAVALLEPFAGGCIPRAELIGIARDAYARFGHPAVTPLVQIDRSLWVLELFHGPTLAFKDVAMQLLSRLMDRVLAARGARVTIVAATSGDTGGAAVEAFRGSERVDAVVLFPQGRISDVQRRMMTTADGGQRARRRRRGHLRRLPGAGQSHVQRPGLPRPGAAGGRQLHQLGRASSPS